jgi:tight adherence protein C
MTLDTIALGASTLLVLAFAAAIWAIRTTRVQHRQLLVQRLALRPAVAVEAPVGGAGVGRSIVEQLRPIARLAAPTDEEQRFRLRLRLANAGFRRDHAVTVFLGTKVILLFGALAGFLWVNASMVRPLPNTGLVGVIVCAAAFYAPNLWLSSRITSRQRAIERALPDALDLLVTCVEAGLALDAAVLRVSGELRRAHPILAEELELTHLEVKAGMPRVDAFRRLAERTGVVDLKQLAATLTQTEMFGTSVGLALRVQSEGMRVRRMQRAEERAAKVAVKMTLPLVFCILPSLFAVIIGPGIVNIMERLMPNLGGR